MELIIQNLGPIKGNHQSIDLSKKFFVFLGYNNSGKTYVSQLIWTIFNQDKHIKFIKSSFCDGIITEAIKEKFWKDKQIELTQELIDKILEKFSLFLQKEILFVYNKDDCLLGFENILIAFKVNVSDFVKTKSTVVITIRSSRQVKIDGEPIWDAETCRLQIIKEPDSLELNIQFIELFDKIPDDSISLGYSLLEGSVEEKLSLEEKLPFLILLILQLLLNSRIGFKREIRRFRSSDTFFLPASRAFFPAFYTYIYEIERNKGQEIYRLVSESESVEDIKKKLFRPSYTEPISKTIEALYDLNYGHHILDFYNDRLIELSEIMGGDIILEKVEGIGPIQFSFRFKENKQATDLPMYLSSSSANQLTLLYLYFKYWAGEKDNFLIIDEPEVNLHPENQIKLLDLLINFVNQSDNKVLIATHSPLLADAVNNYLYIDNLRQYYDDEQIKQIIADNELQYIYPDTKLSREDLGVYFFTGNEIISYDHGHYGIYFRNFKDTTISLKKSSEILTDYIYDKENE